MLVETVVSPVEQQGGLELELLRNGRTYVSENWRKGELGQGDEPVCAVGGLRQAALMAGCYGAVGVSKKHGWVWQDWSRNGDSSRGSSLTAMFGVEIPTGPLADATVASLNRLDASARALFPKRCKGTGLSPAINVNDHPLTSQEDVLAVFDHAIGELT